MVDGDIARARGDSARGNRALRTNMEVVAVRPRPAPMNIFWSLVSRPGWKKALFTAHAQARAREQGRRPNPWTHGVRQSEEEDRYCVQAAQIRMCVGGQRLGQVREGCRWRDAGGGVQVEEGREAGREV